jgi:hypothetical protein
VVTVGFPDIGLQGFAPKLARFNAKAQRCQDAKKKRFLPRAFAALQCYLTTSFHSAKIFQGNDRRPV